MLLSVPVIDERCTPDWSHAATTNDVPHWRDGDRLLVNVNGATIEVRSFAIHLQSVTLQFHARIAAPKEEIESGPRRQLDSYPDSPR